MLFLAHNWILNQSTYHIMVARGRGISKKGSRLLSRSTAVPTRSEGGQTTRRKLQVPREDQARHQSSSSLGIAVRPGRNLKANASTYHGEKVLKSHSKPNSGKYNKISISDLLCDPNLPEQSRPYVCDFPDCRRDYASESTLKAHKSREHNVRTRSVCPTCSATFGNSYAMRKHVRW